MCGVYSSCLTYASYAKGFLRNRCGKAKKKKKICPSENHKYLEQKQIPHKGEGGSSKVASLCPM